MLKEYPVSYKGETVGVASMEQAGLYRFIHCVCSMQKAGLYRVRLGSGTNILDLGTCLQADGHYEIRTRIPAKQIPTNDISFHILEKDDTEEIFYPINEGKPFPYISHLPFARLNVKDGHIGIIYRSSGPQDSDQTP